MARLNREQRLGVLFAGAAFLIWGLVPLYWKMLQDVPALEILAHRIVWALVFLVLWVTLRGRWADLLAVFQRPKTVFALLVSTFLIAINWGTFIWAVNSGRVLQTSLGYFINPLVSVVLGLFFLKERLNCWQWAAIGLAACGVTIITVGVGSLPWISLVLAFSFGTYGLLRKIVRADAVIGLVFETAALAPVAAGFLFFQESRGIGAFGHHEANYLFVVAGLVTAIPLILFTQGVRRIPLSTAGFLQYIAPSCTFSLAVFLYGEPFSKLHAISFGFIWAGLALYTYDLIKAKPAPP